jgi:hypothetical protein
MTVWELAACIDGYNAAQGGDRDPEPMSSAEFDDMIGRHRELIKGG